LNALFSWLALSAPVLSNYVFFGPISIGDAIVILLIPILLIRFNRAHSNIANLLVAFIIIIISHYTLQNSFDVGFLRISFYLIIFLLVISTTDSKFDPNEFFRIYVGFCSFFSISLILQWVFYIFTGVAFSLQLPIPYYEPDTLDVISHVFRSGGWFREPSYLAIFLFPAILVLLEKKRYFSYFLLVVAGILSTSSLIAFAIILSALRFVVIKKSYTLILFTFISVPALLILLWPMFDEWIFVSRLVNIFIYGGTLIDRVLPILEVIQLSTSLGPSQSAFYLVTSGGHSGAVWFSSAAYLIASFGWLGFIFLVANFFRFGFFLSVIFFTLTITTHFFSGPYAFFSAITYLAIRHFNSQGNPAKVSPMKALHEKMRP